MELISTVITSALVATVAGAAINEWLRSRSAKQTAKYEALKAAVSLEGYGISCAQAIISHDVVADSGGHAGATLSRVPDLPDIPKVAVVAEFLRPRKGALMDRMLSFPQKIEQAQQHVDFWWDVTADREDTLDVLVKHAAGIGLEAVHLAADLRAAFNLPSRELVFGRLDVRETLQQKVSSDAGR